MKIRGTGAPAEKVETPMTPMIDVVFQLLIFFMLTLRIVEPEGDFNINMPIGAPAQASPDVPELPPIKVRLTANPDGSLSGISIDQLPLGNTDAAFRKLNDEILARIGGRPGNPLSKDIEVEIDADYGLHYDYTIRAVSACTGRLDPQTQRIVTFIEKVKFAPPRRPKG